MSSLNQLLRYAILAVASLLLFRGIYAIPWILSGHGARWHLCLTDVGLGLIGLWLFEHRSSKVSQLSLVWSAFLTAIGVATIGLPETVLGAAGLAIPVLLAVLSALVIFCGQQIAEA